MELELNYWDCLSLLGIKNEAEARDFEGFCFDRDTGVTVIVESYADGNPMITPGEMADLIRLYPRVQRGEPVLTFPVKWPEFARFIEANGMTGYVDGIKAVNWLLSQDCGRSRVTETASNKPPSVLRADAERNVNAVIGLLTLALALARDKKYMQVRVGQEVPNISLLKSDLTALADERKIDLGGLADSALSNHLSAGQKEIMDRRLAGEDSK